MAILGANTKRLYESLGPQQFVRSIRTAIGLDRDEHDRPVLRESVQGLDGRICPRISTDEFSVKDLAESIVGPDWVRSLDPAGSDGAHHHDHLLESTPAPMHPGQHIHINTWTAVIAGLVEARMLERYQAPEFVANQLVQLIPSKVKQQKMIGVGRTGKKARNMQPGDPHPRANFGERWVTLPETVKRGLAIELTKEIIFYDLTSQVMQQAEDVGESLALNREDRIWDVILGVSNSYIYNDTSYNTYLTTGNWVNLFTNELVDWTDIDENLSAAADMKDQETSNLIAVNLDTIVVMPSLKLRAGAILNASTVEGRSERTIALPGSLETRIGSNPVQDMFKLVASPYAYQRAIASDGLNLSTASAKKLWYMLNSKKAFGYVENWPANVRRASPSDYQMVDHDVVFAVFANESGEAGVLDPRFVIKNTEE